MKKHSRLLWGLIMVVAGSSLWAQQKPVDLEFWVTPAVTEAAGIPDDWVGYGIIRDKLGVNLKVSFLPGTPQDADTKNATAAAANRLPDLVHLNQGVWDKLVRQGVLAPVDSLLAKMPERTKTHYSDPIRNKIVTRKVAGKSQMMGFPEPGQIPRTEGLVIRKDWLDKLGLKVPVTTEDFLKVATAFTTQDPDGNGKADTYGFGTMVEVNDITEWGLGRRWDPVMGAFGVPGMFNTDPATFSLQARRPEFYDALSFVNRLAKAGVLDPDWATMKKDEFRIRWKQGKYGMIREQFAALLSLSNYAPFDKNFPQGEWIAIPPPKGPKGHSYEGMDKADIRIYAVSKRAIAENKGEAIAKVLEWMASDEGYFLCGFGQRGVNYNLDANGDITLADLPDPKKAYNQPAMQPLTQLRNLVYINNELELKPRYPTYKTASGRTINQLATLQFFQKQPFYDAVAAQVVVAPVNSADFSRFYNENVVKFALGVQELNPTSWKKFLDGLDSLNAKKWEADARMNAVDAGLLD